MSVKENLIHAHNVVCISYSMWDDNSKSTIGIFVNIELHIELCVYNDDESIFVIKFSESLLFLILKPILK